jgi:hypothetical protein
MTPQDKAKELVSKFSKDAIRDYKCALIAVDEIIEYINTSGSVNFWWLNYLEEVKQEIEKL